jgi:hypothetical protein
MRSIYLCTLFLVSGCFSSDQSPAQFDKAIQNLIECDNVACDTITTYKLFHLIGADTVVYDYTYKDTVLLNSKSGEIFFANNRCQSCTGTQKVYVLNQGNKVIDSVNVIHKGDAISEKISLEQLSRSLPGILKIEWEGFGGRTFYLNLN